MPKVITLSGMRQSSSLKGWDKCDPIEGFDDHGNKVVHCAGTKAITLSGTHSDAELTENAKRDLKKRYPGIRLGAASCKPKWKTMKNGKRRCHCGNRFVKSAACKGKK
jgi:hypothetical protein